MNLHSNVVRDVSAGVHVQMEGMSVQYAQVTSQFEQVLSRFDTVSSEMNELRSTIVSKLDNMSDCGSLSPRSLDTEDGCDLTDDLSSRGSSRMGDSDTQNVSDQPLPSWASDVSFSPASNVSGFASSSGSIMNISMSALVSNPQSKCRAWCPCRCHYKGKLRTPAFFQQYMGSLFLSYSGTPKLNFQSTCDEKTCKSETPLRINVNYQYPAWYGKKMLDYLFVLKTFSGRPRTQLRLRNVHHASGNTHAELIHACMNGQIDVLQRMFTSGRARPSDLLADFRGVVSSLLAVCYVLPSLLLQPRSILLLWLYDF